MLFWNPPLAQVRHHRSVSCTICNSSPLAISAWTLNKTHTQKAGLSVIHTTNMLLPVLSHTVSPRRPHLCASPSSVIKISSFLTSPKQNGPHLLQWRLGGKGLSWTEVSLTRTDHSMMFCVLVPTPRVLHWGCGCRQNPSLALCNPGLAAAGLQGSSAARHTCSTRFLGR